MTSPKRFVAVTGATGLIGRALCPALLRAGHRVAALSRNPDRAARLLPPAVVITQWNAAPPYRIPESLAECDALVNLAGENLTAGGRWTQESRRLLLESRTRAIEAVASAMSTGTTQIRTIVQASAVGYYGPSGDAELDESAPAGAAFLSQIAAACERGALGLSSPAVRVTTVRTGIVLSRDGGALPRLTGPLRLGFGGVPGRGTQWVSWIHIDDEVRAILFALEHEKLRGAINLVAPNAVRMRDLINAAGRVLHRPVWVPVPAFALRAAFGEMADEALLTGQHVVPRVLVENGFVFSFPNLEPALAEVLGRATPHVQ
jgi:uncharacterized protein